MKGLCWTYLLQCLSRSLIYFICSGQSILAVWVLLTPLLKWPQAEVNIKNFLMNLCGEARKSTAHQWMSYDLVL